ncbi:MAG TPA: bifunctional ornithine acetyltransferase/N-acetylglutamate synthase, partial [Acidimicrobiia bacterium]|nr:bifunctional ornithine acetyltransferase/N-acetylglutamate synthase [Acidimicrobiia bacterium]
YWGRVLSELGASGVTLEPERVSISYNGVTVCLGGVAAVHDASAAAAAMEGREIDVSCELGLGVGTATVLTSDLTHAYIDENMRTS